MKRGLSRDHPVLFAILAIMTVGGYVLVIWTMRAVHIGSGAP